MGVLEVIINARMRTGEYLILISVVSYRGLITRSVMQGHLMGMIGQPRTCRAAGSTVNHTHGRRLRATPSMANLCCGTHVQLNTPSSQSRLILTQ